MGRHKRFTIGQVVIHNGIPCVVVDYRQDRRKRGSYRLVRLLFLPAGRGYGPAAWIDSQHIQASNWPERRWTAVRIARANARLGDRGCQCECCCHIQIPLDQVLSDGTFTWEKEEEDAQSVLGGEVFTDEGNPNPPWSEVP